MNPMTIQSHAHFTAERLLEPGMPEKFFEIIGGTLVMMVPADWGHNEVASAFDRLFWKFRRGRRDLWSGGQNDMFLIKRDPDLLLSPDASLFRKRASSTRPWRNFTPEVLVEVLSPSNSKAEIAYKKLIYFETGAEQVWIVDPEDRRLDIYHRDGRLVLARGDAVLEGEGIAEGLKIPLAMIFEDYEPLDTPVG